MDSSTPFKGSAATPYDYHVKQEQMMREYQIALENMAIVRENLKECARTEGVNQFTNCREIREEYVKLVQDRHHGIVFPSGEEPKSRQTPGVTYGRK